MFQDVIGGIILLILCAAWSLYRTIKKPLQSCSSEEADISNNVTIKGCHE